MVPYPSMRKRLSAFLGSINHHRFRGTGDPVITGLHYDSRKVSPGSIFFALPGIHTDGHDFIGTAAAAGAAAVVHEKELPHYDPKIAYIRVVSSRTAMSEAAAAFYGRPSAKLHLIGVTGTDGKSSTVYFIHQLLRFAGERAGFLSTVQFDTGDGALDNFLRQSTPEAPEIHALLHEMAEKGCRYAVVEATSHGLSPATGRLRDVVFRTGVFTNISHEHLEFHGTFERYRGDKAELFRKLAGGHAVINLDDPEAAFFIEAARGAGAEISTYGMDRSGADCSVLSFTEDADGIDFTLGLHGESYPARLSMNGRFNLENFMAAFLAVRRLGILPPEKLAGAARELKPVAGRMNRIGKGQPFGLIVDYAHTPNSFSRLMPLLREQTKGRLIAVFGSAGERDTEKRPLQGEIASRYCDLLFLADEDPRGEEPTAILGQIAAGCRGRTEGKDLFLIPDRRKAILSALKSARPGDTVVLLGKGHEKSIIYRDGPIEWDESIVAEECLGELGYTPT